MADFERPTSDLAVLQEASREELTATVARLEGEKNSQIVLHQELIVARDQLDRELLRFKTLADYIGQALAIDDPADFRTLTLEALIKAFEFEVALFLGVDENGALCVLEHFGFDSPPTPTLPWNSAWVGEEATICQDEHALLKSWPSLCLSSLIVCPYHDNDGQFRGIVAGGITTTNEKYYDPIEDGMRSSFRLMVEQAGSIQVRQLLNQEMVSLTESYSRFVPFEFLKLLGRQSIQDIGVGDHIALEMAVLFSDLRGFTALSEELRPDEVFALLNDYLAATEPTIRANGGFINQYQGDAIMALFHPGSDAAVAAAVGMHRALDDFNTTRVAAQLPPLKAGIGIHYGPLMLGAIGGAQRLDSNVVGDTANLASRTEGMTKFYGAKLLVTENTKEALVRPNARTLRELDRVVVKGRKESITIYEVIDADPPNLREKKLGYQATFAEGLNQYRNGEFRQARLGFMQCVLQAPDDGAANLYVDRCGELDRRPPYVWTGVTVLEEK